jgi:hypothetical protein
LGSALGVLLAGVLVATLAAWKMRKPTGPTVPIPVAPVTPVATVSGEQRDAEREPQPEPLTTTSPPPVDQRPTTTSPPIHREAGIATTASPQARLSYRDVVLDPPLPATVDTQAFREWFAKRKGALLSCYRTSAPLKSCAHPADDLGYNCLLRPDGTPRKCELGSATMTAEPGCVLTDDACFKNVIFSTRFPPPKSGNEEWATVHFHPVE